MVHGVSRAYYEKDLENAIPVVGGRAQKHGGVSIEHGSPRNGGWPSRQGAERTQVHGGGPPLSSRSGRGGGAGCSLAAPPADVDAASAGALPGSEVGIRPHSRACRIQKAAVLGDASAFRSCVAARGTTRWKDVRTAS